MDQHAQPFDLIEASIDEILAALAAGRITSRWLTERYLARAEAYDRGDAGLHAIIVENPEALAQADESDRRWAAGEARPLEGVPFTVKDSYMVQGLTVAAGSPAFEHLIAQWDAFSVAQLRAAGAVLIGKTNMPPMADGGMQRGVYGRAENPYNRDYLAAAYASGSSNGSGVSTAANLAVFGMGEETVSSGRSPASNNGLCAYTPSWGVLSIRGNWPLFPARDVVVPHARTMPDMLRILDVLVADDDVTRGDFWRHQQVVPVPKPSEHRPASYLSLQQPGALSGKRFAVPRMYLGEDPAFPIEVRPSVLDQFAVARAQLEALGAELVVTDFPLIEQYEGDRPGQENVAALGVLPAGWMDTEFNEILAFGWDDFLRANGDPAIPNLGVVDPDQIFPQPAGTLPDRYEEVADYENRYRATVAIAQAGIADPRERADFAPGLRSLVQLREELFESWLTAEGFDGVIFPANADVGAEDAERDEAAADRAWANGVFFSNGNYALRHLGIPTVTVPMGLMGDIGVPIGLTFAGRAYADLELLGYAAAFESAGSLRIAPAAAPGLPGDRAPAR
ncbi:amidase [Leucobacter exalbidus]|uniref:Amidase n=1 Tax=Leucobacter exalbidus TaxID=662960 RepID=A0A940PRY4_9MICO|nr:amidase [Leucobacter exalbidus]MBP1325617.1 amidase [Leucobacter exalbidus]